MLIPALGAGAVAFLLARVIQTEERIAREKMGCACHKKIRYWVDEDGNTTEFLAGRPEDEDRPRQPCPVCKRGAF